MVINTDGLGLIAKYGTLMGLLNGHPALQNLITAMYNDKNKFAMFLACPVSIATIGSDHPYVESIPADVMIRFDTARKSTWMMNPSPKNDCVKLHTLNIDGSINIPNKTFTESHFYGFELRCYEGKLSRSQVDAEFLNSLGIDFAIVTDNEIFFGKKK